MAYDREWCEFAARLRQELEKRMRGEKPTINRIVNLTQSHPKIEPPRESRN